MAKRGRTPKGVDPATYDRGGYQPTPAVAVKLATWRELASQGVPCDVIARQIGYTTKSLGAFLTRARLAGHPDAIYHPKATGGARRRFDLVDDGEL